MCLIPCLSTADHCIYLEFRTSNPQTKTNTTLKMLGFNIPCRITFSTSPIKGLFDYVFREDIFFKVSISKRQLFRFSFAVFFLLIFFPKIMISQLLEKLAIIFIIMTKMFFISLPIYKHQIKIFLFKYIYNLIKLRRKTRRNQISH